MEKQLIIKGFANKDMEKTLVSRGVPPQDLPSRNTRIRVDESLVKIEPSIENVLSRTVSTGRQLKLLERYVEHPVRSSYTLCISSFPSDLRAKHLAIFLMSKAIEQHRLGHRKPGRGLPLWHRVYGGFGDVLRDKPVHEMPCMLIVSNVNIGSSQAMIEKVRDLLERYSEIPRIVVTGGEPPCNLFANKLFYPLHAGIYLGPDNRVKEI